MMMHHDTQPLVTLEEQLRHRQSTAHAAQGRRIVHAGADALAVARLEVVRRHLHLRPGVRERWRAADRAVDRRRQLRGGVEAPAALDQADLNPAGLLYFFNPLRLLLSLVWSKSYIAHADRETRPAEEVARLSPWKQLKRWLYLESLAPIHRRRHASSRHGGSDSNGAPHAPLDLATVARTIVACEPPPASEIPMRNPAGGPASHALPVVELTVTTLPFRPRTTIAEPTGSSKAA